MILQALKSYYDRVAGYEGTKIAPPGYSYQNISFAIILADDGVGARHQRSADDGGANASATIDARAASHRRRSGKKPPPAFLWDKTGYVFGVERSDDANEPIAENPAYREAFREYHKALAGREQ